MNTMSKSEVSHTPGPWSYYEPHCKDGGWIMTDARAWGRQITGMFYGQPSERIANGHLIAAAPDLLEACKVALRLDYVREHPAISKILTDAISQAENHTQNL